MSIFRFGSDPFQGGPFQDVLRLQRSIDRVFERPSGRSTGRGLFPGLNVFDDGNALVVKAEVPGMNREDLSVELVGDKLTLSGTRVASEAREGEDRGYHRRERDHGSYRRVFRLPYEVDREKVAATYRDGLLTVKLERAESAKPRAIEVSC